jgi:paraquat-inducible protein B
VRLVGAEPGVIEIPTIPSPIQEMMGELQKLKLDQLIGSADKLINNIDALINTPEAKALMPEILKLVDDARRLIVALDAEVAPTVKSFRDAADAGTAAMAHFDKEMGPVMTDIRRMVSEINGSLPKTMQRLDAVLLSAGDAVKPNSASMRDLQRALKEFSAASYAVRALAEELQRNPSSVIRGR